MNHLTNEQLIQHLNSWNSYKNSVIDRIDKWNFHEIYINFKTAEKMIESIKNILEKERNIFISM